MAAVSYAMPEAKGCEMKDGSAKKGGYIRPPPFLGYR